MNTRRFPVHIGLGIALGFSLLSSLKAQQLPANDMIADAIVIPALPAQVTGSSVGATVEPNELPLFSFSVWASVWWRWTATTTGRVYVDTLGSSFDTVVAVFSGHPVTARYPLARDDDGAGGSASRIDFQAIAGIEYYFAVKGFLGASGDVVLNIWQGGFPPRYFTQPQSATVTPGSAVSFGISLIGPISPTPSWSYQWRKNSSEIAGATNSTITVTNVQDFDAGEYSLVISNTFGRVVSSNATLSVLPIWISSQPQSLVIATGYTASFTVSASGPPPVSYQWLKDDVELAGANGATLTFTNVQPAHAGRYSVRVIDALTNTLSSNATLQVIAPYTFVTLAGRRGTPGAADGVWSAAKFNQPHGIAVDAKGYVYVTEVGNSTIRRISPGGTVTTIAGLAGSPGTNDGPALSARFKGPFGLALDDAGTLFVADSGNHTIRKISPDGIVATMAGAAGVTGSTDGSGNLARFNEPADVAAAENGNLFVADHWNDRIRMITPDLVVTQVAGLGVINSYPTDGTARKAALERPVGLGLDAHGTIYFADEYSHTIRKLTADGFVTTIAGSPNHAGSSDGAGSSARFNYPHGAKLDAEGNIYIADDMNCTIRRVTPEGLVTTIAGLPGPSSWGDGTGRNARFSQVRGVAVDRWGNLYVTDYDNHTIRKGWSATASEPPVITVQPQSQTVVGGTNLLLAVGAGGTGLFCYQWWFAGAPMPGQTNDTLSLISVQRTNTGIYSVVVSNEFGTATSQPALIRVLVAPVLQPPSILSGGTLRLQFRDCDGGLPGDLANLTVQWRTNLPSGADTNWEELAPGFYLTNGFIAVDDTNACNHATRFYRVLVK